MKTSRVITHFYSAAVSICASFIRAGISFSYKQHDGSVHHFFVEMDGQDLDNYLESVDLRKLCKVYYRVQDTCEK